MDQINPVNISELLNKINKINRLRRVRLKILLYRNRVIARSAFNDEAILKGLLHFVRNDTCGHGGSI